MSVYQTALTVLGVISLLYGCAMMVEVGLFVRSIGWYHIVDIPDFLYLSGISLALPPIAYFVAFFELFVDVRPYVSGVLVNMSMLCYACVCYLTGGLGTYWVDLPAFGMAYALMFWKIRLFQRWDAIVQCDEYLALKETRRAFGAHTVLYAHGLGASDDEAYAFLDRNSAQFYPIKLCSYNGNANGRLRRRDVCPTGGAYTLYGAPLLKPESVVTLSSSPWPLLDIGGEHDAQRYAMRAASYIRTSDAPVVLFGMSRGSATVFNALTVLREQSDWETKLRPKIALVVCAGTFATVDDVLEHRFPTLLGKFIAWFCSQRHFGYGWSRDEPWAPVKRVSKLPGGVPIAFIAAEKDRNVPVTTTRRLLRAIAQENERRGADEEAIRVMEPLFLHESGHAFWRASAQETRVLMSYMATVLATLTAERQASK